MPDTTGNSDLLAYNPGKAEKLLDEADWVKGPTSILIRDGKQLSLTIHSNPYIATAKSIDELIAQQLGEIVRRCHASRGIFRFLDGPPVDQHLLVGVEIRGICGFRITGWISASTKKA